MEFYLYCLLFVVAGVPLIGYALKKILELGKFMYNRYPLIRRFFDEYAENFGVGLLITIATLVVYGILRWFGVFP
jgi:hypothetical protein